MWGDDVNRENWTSGLDRLTPARGPSPGAAEPHGGDGHLQVLNESPALHAGRASPTSLIPLPGP